MTEAPAIEPRNVHEAIVAVMRSVGYVQKVKTPGLNYSFASEADLIAAIRPHMVAVGLSFAPVEMLRISDQEVTSKGGSVGNRVVIACTWEFCHAPSDTRIRVVSQGEGVDYGDKASNKAMTTALKYALRQTFLIETGDDPDLTPSEQLEHLPTAAKATEVKRDWTAVAPRLAHLLKEEGVIPKMAIAKHVLAFLNLTPFGPAVSDADLLAWGHLYRDVRDEDETVEAKDAAAQASKQFFQGEPA